LIWAVLPVCLFLISSVVMSFSLEASQVIPTDTEDPKTERLFREMGIIEVPHITPPVDFSLIDINGRQFTLSEFKGKIVFLNFWTTWCPECRIEMPSMEKLHRRLNGQDFEMIAVNIQEPALQVKNFLEKYQLTFSILLDAKGEIGRQFGIRAIPATYILDKNGGIIGKAFGSRHWDGKKSIALFEHLINRVVQNTKTNEHEQKKGISSNSVKSDTGIGNSADDPTYIA
jgi:cytochrome c biogenesis protein CcmG/thiol:disulfide interchange protein DsbE